MTDRDISRTDASWIIPGKAEFVAMMAALMAVNALAIDSMLPALARIAHALGVADPNRRQLVVTFYLLGFGAGQLFYGPVSDRLGRKRILTGGLAFYGLFALASGLATSFAGLLAARFLQGLAAASSRVLAVAIIRDRFHGPAMARTMSLVSIVFMIVPVLAPAFGQTMLLFAPWRFIFIGLGVYCLAVLAWTGLRLPETHPPERRRPLSVGHVAGAIRETLRHRLSIGNTFALTLVMGGLFAFITSIQQIVFDVFGRPRLMAVVFASIAGPMAASSWVNSRIVERIGSRRIMLAALASFSGVATLHLVLVWANGGESLPEFVILHALTMASFGLIAANLGAVAMEPLGHIAGTASSVQGTITTIGGALIGLAIGQSFDGTTLPFLIGFTLCGTAALGVALWTNRPGEKMPGSLADVPG